ncbi:hypothetical protein AOZ06_10210 [Kibdelosporangium phytohabitans]|uniref:Glycosyl transferase family 1 domain-containing protein n=1 Tax=Kibdelosporangium phytohabitans TaxID=860235 RepID=A0A0N9HY94_9PSEU|nr:hypothetical protein AOZ06_10210 [Kibdelosporangium phytohabitans]
MPDDELVRAYQRADVFCMPGTAELQSLATMGAMALPHLAGPGVDGFRYPPGNVAVLAAALGEVLRDRSVTVSMGRASREKIAAHNTGHTLTAFEEVYVAADAAV